MTWEGLFPPYSTIVVDPPWRVNRPNGWGKGTSASVGFLPYSTMTIPEIQALPVGDLAEDVCHLYLWTVNRYVPDAYETCARWGFQPSSLLTWIKEPRGVGPGGYYCSTTEFVLFARRGKGPKVPAVKHPSSWFDFPRGMHSEKPQAFYDIVERVSPGPYVELFARSPRLFWDSWGYGYESASA